MDKPTYIVEADGTPLRFPQGSKIAKKIERSGKFYEHGMLEAIRGLRLKGVYIDVGAHVGNHSVYFVTRCQATKVIAIEPNPENLDLLRANTDGLAVTIEPCAMGYSTGVIRGDEHEQVKGMEGERVRCIALSLVLTPDVVFVKMDVEGFETQIIEGSLDAIERVKPAFAIENHGGVESKTHQQQVRVLEPLGYKLLGVYNATPTMLWRAE